MCNHRGEGSPGSAFAKPNLLGAGELYLLAMFAKAEMENIPLGSPLSLGCPFARSKLGNKVASSPAGQRVPCWRSPEPILGPCLRCPGRKARRGDAGRATGPATARHQARAGVVPCRFGPVSSNVSRRKPRLRHLEAPFVASYGLLRTASAGAAMSPTLEVVQAQVMSLSKEDRSRLLERLVASLDVDAEAEEEWEQLAAQREAELDSGAVVGVPLEEAMAQLRARFPG